MVNDTYSFVCTCIYIMALSIIALSVMVSPGYATKAEGGSTRMKKRVGPRDEAVKQHSTECYQVSSFGLGRASRKLVGL